MGDEAADQQELAPSSASVAANMQVAFPNPSVPITSSSGEGKASEPEDDEQPDWGGSSDRSVDDEAPSWEIPDFGFQPTKQVKAELEHGLPDNDKDHLLEVVDAANLRQDML